MTVSNNWVNALRADEVNTLNTLEALIKEDAAILAGYRKQRRSLYLMARKRMERAQKGVDVNIEKA